MLNIKVGDYWEGMRRKNGKREEERDEENAFAGTNGIIIQVVQEMNHGFPPSKFV